MIERVCVLTRRPDAGHTKTRMIPALGPEGAANLQCRMTAFVLDQVAALKTRRPVSAEVRYCGGNREQMSALFGREHVYRPQPPGDLGERMHRIVCDACSEGMQQVVLIGSDCPGLGPDVLEGALRALERYDLVLGPAEDGGYYLIGLRRPTEALFRGPAWGTGTVLRDTLEIAGGLGLSHQLLPTLADVDRPEDLPVWREAQRRQRRERLSVIIPTLNEGETIQPTLACVAGGESVEAIVVDAGSEDGTVHKAREAGSHVIEGPRGRAAQLNRGAATASGELLLFLHADTLLPRVYDLHVRRTLRRPGVVAGAFSLKIASADPRLRLIERTANWRSRVLQMPYGDQGIFMRAKLFAEMGGFPLMPLMDDYELVRQLARRGRIETVEAPVRTSARRWQRLGPWRTMLMNQWVIACYHAGVSPERLAAWYRRQNQR